MVQDVSGVLSSIHRRLQAILRHRQPNFRNIPGRISSELPDRYREPLRAVRISLFGIYRDIRLRSVCRFFDFRERLPSVASHELALPIHNHLRRIFRLVKDRPINGLSLRPFR